VHSKISDLLLGKILLTLKIIIIEDDKKSSAPSAFSAVIFLARKPENRNQAINQYTGVITDIRSDPVAESLQHARERWI
jgi:hypothetical protein